MMKKRLTKIQRFRGVFVGFLMLLMMLTSSLGVFGQVQQVSAEPVDTVTPTTQETGRTADDGAETLSVVSDESQQSENTSQRSTSNSGITKNVCKSSLGSLGWVVCPIMEKASEAVDWLYGMIEDLLLINPIKAEDGSPIYEIWKYCLNVANIVFIIFLLIVIYSQLTGVGISNYGIKKVLPKLIITAIMVNLSFLICSLAVDVSNIVGSGLRSVFEAVEQTAMSNMAAANATTTAVSMAEVYTSMAGGAALAIGAGAATIAFAPGAIWMLIPTVLGAVVSVATGLITIALRQAVVVLLVMIAPLAFVANILPNTEQWFKKWKQLLERMLVFYPMFSLLFGASSLAGFALIASAKDIFWVLLGLAVQIFPLFFSWKMMQMSGTFLGDINSKLRGLAAKPLATNRAWADSRRQLARQKKLASGTTPSARLMQFMNNRKVAREEEISELAASAKLRGQAYAANRNYRRNGLPSREGEEAYARQARNMEYQYAVDRHKDNMNMGLGQLAIVEGRANAAQKARLARLDLANVEAADKLKIEKARGAKIEYDNAVGYYERVKKANYANADLEALNSGNRNHQMHDGVLEDRSNIARYGVMREIMGGKDGDVKYALADAAHAYEVQSQIVRGKYKSHFDNTEATQDIVNELNALTNNDQANANIDAIIAGVRALNMRGDTNLAWEQLNNVLQSGSVKIGSHALQTISSYCMFDVKGNDPAMRRFGKYINLETAKMFNEADPSERRTRRDISLYEYINGEYIDRDENGNVIYGTDGQPVIRKTKKNAGVLLKGTSFKDMERTGIATMEDMIRAASVDLRVDENGNEIGTFNYEKFKKNEKAIWNAILPNVIGDHFSFLSGSEQIMAMSKGLTGVDVGKHKIDWEGIFGKTGASQLTTEQKKDYLDFLHARTKSFLGGQVPSQIARTKSDMLEAVRNQYALMEAIKHDPTLLDRMSDPDFRMSNEDYKRIEDEYLEEIKHEFINSFKEDALKGFVKMHHKGYQGEAKDGLIQLLDPDALYRQYFGSSDGNRPRRHSNVDEDDDGMPVDFSDALDGMGGPIYNDTRAAIESVFNAYRGARRRAVGDFWDDIKSILLNSNDTPSSGELIDGFESRLPQYTDVSTLYADIMNQVFGGFSE